MIFKLYNCDLGVKIQSVSYYFEHVDSVAIEDPEFTRLTRGSNAGNLTGLVYKEGIKDPKRLTATLIGVSKDMHDLLEATYLNKDRVDFFCIDRTDGSSKIGKNAVLCQKPQQIQLDDTPESMNVVLTFETFDLSEGHKS